MQVRLTNPSDAQVHFILSPSDPSNIYRVKDDGEKFDLGFIKDKEKITQIRLEPHESRLVEMKNYFFFSSAFLNFCGIWYNIFRDQKSSVSREISILPKYYRKIIV